MSSINRYRTMWTMVLFDLPTTEENDRKAYTQFRKGLIKDGFIMMQYSVYVRHCASRENAEVHVSRVKATLPHEGMVSIMTITDKQFGDIKNYWGRRKKLPAKQPEQLEIF